VLVMTALTGPHRPRPLDQLIDFGRPRASTRRARGPRPPRASHPRRLRGPLLSTSRRRAGAVCAGGDGKDEVVLMRKARRRGPRRDRGPAGRTKPAPRALRSKRSGELSPSTLLGIEPLVSQDIQTILDTADALRRSWTADQEGPRPPRETVINLFYEPSTRTAPRSRWGARALGGQPLDRTAASSVTKGDAPRHGEEPGGDEPDMVIMRHASSGRRTSSPPLRFSVVNRGDGATSTPPRPARRPHMRRKGGSRACASRSWATSCTAAWRLEPLALPKMGASVVLCGRPPSCRPGSRHSPR